MHQFVIQGLSHDPDQGFRARFAYNHPAALAQQLVRLRQGIAHACAFKGIGAIEGNVDQFLWCRLKHPHDTGSGQITGGERLQHLKCRQQAVACGRDVGQDDMAGLFAAQIETMLAHMFADIAIAHFGTCST